LFKMMQGWGHALRSIELNIAPMLGFALFFRILGILIFTPLISYGLSSLIHVTGDLAITNADIASFMLSPVGATFLGLSIVAVLVGIFAEQGGFMMIIAASEAGKRVQLLGVFRTVIACLPRLMSVTVAQTVIGILCLLPIVAIAGWLYSGLLGAHDINWYLKERPPEFIAAIVFGALLICLGLFTAAMLMIWWAVSIPVCFFEQHYGLAALRRSRELVRGHMGATGIQMLGWTAVIAIVVAAGATASDWIADLLVSRVSNVHVLVTVMALILGMGIVASFIMSFIGFAGYSIISYSLYKEFGGKTPVPGSRAIDGTVLRLSGAVIAAMLAVIMGVSAYTVNKLANELSNVHKVEITAHRGSSKKAPENTLSAIRQAIEDGADYAEIDVQETADGTIVLLHDSDLLRVAGSPAKIWDISDGELAKLEAGAWFSPAFKGEPIPLLRQAIALARGKIKLNIELKYNGHDVSLAKRVVEIVLAEDFAKDCFIASLEAAGLAEVRALAPQLRTGQIVTVAVGRAENLPVNVLSMNRGLVSARQVRLNRKAGRETHVWTINDMPSMLEMIDTGVDNIITDEPADLKRVIADRAELSQAELLLLSLSRKIKGSK
jgi:glycerophosphoryl diester phosphodiesterase